MTAKQFLVQYLEAEKKISSLTWKMEERREALFSLSQSLSERVQRSRCVDSAQRRIDSCGEEERHFSEAVARQREIQKKVKLFISLLKDPDQCLALELHYIKELPWAKVAEKMRFQERQIYRIHGKGLEKLEELLDISQKLTPEGGD